MPTISASTSALKKVANMKLTDLAVKSLPIPEKGQKTYLEQGLGVRVSQGGSRTFVMKHEGRWVTLGKYPLMSLKQARAAFLQRKVTVPPKTRLKSLTEARSAYLAECEQKNRPATVKQYRHFLSQVDRPTLTDVQRSDVDVSSPHAVMAWRVFFNWCIRNELVDKNPFAYTKVTWGQRTRLLTDQEVARLLAYEHQPYSDYIKLLFLTGQRIGQFKSYTVQDDTVVFSASVMKNKLEHIIPITDTTRPIFERLQPFNGWSRAKRRIDTHTKVQDWVHHDARRYVSSTLAALQVPIAVTEYLLSHTISQGSSVQSVYNRYNYLREMKSALTLYEKHILSLVA